jgi:hypothetical protein
MARLDEAKHKTYVIRVKREYLRALPENPLDVSSGGRFESRERAEDWCQALNWCAGYDRFGVQEVTTEKHKKQAA